MSTSYITRQDLTCAWGCVGSLGLRSVIKNSQTTPQWLRFIHALQFRKKSQNPAHPPAMTAGLADHVWSLEEIALLAK
ncbi:MAG: hypothetical protein DMF60_20555 [Acidobacteria bacterium]|nr:MAG: hypothetical protein DMF60_20555 [Acidobacteriota bacterium]